MTPRDEIVERQGIIERVKPKPMLAELCINIGDGQAVISPEGTVEFCDTGMNISLRDLQFVVQEAEAYLTYRGERGAIQELKQHQKAKYLTYQGECGERDAQTETH